MRKLNISSKLMRNATDKDRLINKIIEIEWGMFDKVENMGGRADCQDNDDTFYIMRYSNFNAFAMGTLESYLQDLDIALSQGRNLITEKYAYIMEYTDKEYFEEALKHRIPEVSDEKEKLVTEISKLFAGYEEEFMRNHTAFASVGRPIKGFKIGMVSSEIYLKGELKTYSTNTLKLCLKDAKIYFHDGKNDGANIVQRIHKKTAELYGYENIEAAEKKLEHEI